MPRAKISFSRLPFRLWHHYIGMLIAPSVLFFSLTGVTQILNLHESHIGYRAPALIAMAAHLHKDQILPKLGSDSKSGNIKPASHYTLQQVLLKTYWIGMALGLIVSTLLGMVMSLQNKLRRRAGMIILGLGTIIPIILAVV